MAAKRRHWKEKDGRFWARISIPVELRPFFDNRTQLAEPLGGDLRIADRNHATAVARLQAQIDAARRQLADNASSDPTETVSVGATPVATAAHHRALTETDSEKLVWDHFTTTLAHDAVKRVAMPTPKEIEDEQEKVLERFEAGGADVSAGPAAFFNAYTDFELKARARIDDANLRTRRLFALKSAISTGETRFVDASVQDFVDENQLTVKRDTLEWKDLAEKIMRAQIQALEQTLELDRGVFGGTPTDPIVHPPAKPRENISPVSLKGLFSSYIAMKQNAGKHLDGGSNWEQPIRSLVDFLGHDDARRIIHQNLLDWRNSLGAEGKSAKTIRDKYLAAVRAVLRWAFKERRLPTNEIADVQQEAPKKVRIRERGFTTPEAVRILNASLHYEPIETANPSNRESDYITAAKRWVPLLCAFTGARPAEITQLRKQDVRKEEGRWILRITPEAGSVKSSEYRDVPLHKQVVDFGFIKFVRSSEDGPLFHRATAPEKNLGRARTTSGRLSTWLHMRNLIPKGVQPNYGWRHRFKTQGRELGMSDRVLDAIQGHPGTKAADDYGDVTITAKLRLIDALPDYVLDGSSENQDAGETKELTVQGDQ